MKFDSTIHYRLAADALQVDAPRMLPYVVATLTTKLAQDIKPAVQAEMPRVFDRPVDFTLRGVAVKAATKATMTAEVYVPDSDSFEQAKRHYLRPGVYGAYKRSQKKTEFLLKRTGFLPASWVTTPGKGAKLDSHGNLSGRIYAQIINVLQIKAAVVGGRASAERARKSAARLKVAALYFAVAPGANKLGKGGGWLPPGVWKHLPGGKITQILKFVKAAGYTPKLSLAKVGRDVVRKQIGTRWRESVSLIKERFDKRGGN
jgi:hypothetical protein